MNKFVVYCPNNRTKHLDQGHVVQKTETNRPLDMNNERYCPQPDEWKQERVRKAVDNLLKNIAPSRCCMPCPGQDTAVPCDSFKFLLKCVQDGGLQAQQSDRDYEQTIVEEIKRRMNLGICGNVPLPPPVMDYVEVPKKRKQVKKVVKKKEVEIPKLVIPKPVVKPPKPKKKPKKTRPTEDIIFLYPSDFKIDDTPPAAGTIQYRLSNRDFIQKGWTKIPIPPEIKYKTFNTFQTDPCGPLVETNIWKKRQSYRFYPDGRKMATIEKDGTTKVFYPNCKNDLAIHLTPYGENDYRIVVYFNKEEYLNDSNNHLKRKDLPAALFDSFGNGVVYSTKGNIRLNYDQAEGKFVEKTPNTIHPPLHWKWQSYQEISRRRKMLHHMSYGCPNIGKKYPNLIDFLPQQKESSKNDHRRQSNDSNPVLEVLDGSDKQQKSQKSVKVKTNRGKKDADYVTQSNSDEKTLKSNSPPSPKSPKMSRASWRRRHREEQESQKFEICASELNLDDPLFEKLKEQDKLQTPLRIVLRIENGITLVIMDQCHIHLEFKAFRQHLKFNLGVRVLFKEEPKFTDTLPLESTSMTPPPDMFRVYEHRSLSLQKLFHPQNLLLGKDKSKQKPNELICERKKTKTTDSKECILFRAPKNPILIRNQCVLEPGETRPILPLKLIYHFHNK